MRLFFRILALIALGVAVIIAVVDIARSLSASSLVLTSVQKGWADVAPSSLLFFQTYMQENLPVMMTEAVLALIFNLPIAAFFTILAVIFYAIGAKREKPFGQFGLH